MRINGLAGIWKTKINLENGIHYMQKNVMPYEKLSHKAKNIGKSLIGSHDTQHIYF